MGWRQLEQRSLLEGLALSYNLLILEDLSLPLHQLVFVHH